MAGKRLTLLLPARPKSLNAIRRQVLGFIQRTPFEARNGDILVVISEACTNVVRHAYTEDHRRPTITLRAVLNPDNLVFVIGDRGKGLESVESEPVFSEEGGFGLFLMRRLADNFECWSSSAGTVLQVGFESNDPDTRYMDKKRKSNVSIRDIAAVVLAALSNAAASHSVRYSVAKRVRWH